MADLTEHYKTLYEAQSRRVAKNAFQMGYLARWLHEETGISTEVIMAEAKAARDCPAEEVSVSD